MMLDFGFTFVATFSLLCIVSPFHLIIIFVFLIFCFRSTSIYVSVSTDIKRINSLALSPMISTLGEIINGNVTIRQYQKLDYIRSKLIRSINMYIIAQGHLFFSSSYLRVRVKYMLFVVIALSIAAIFVNKIYRFILFQDPTTQGLLLTYIV